MDTDPHIDHDYSTHEPHSSIHDIPATVFDIECTQLEQLPGYCNNFFDQLKNVSLNNDINLHGLVFSETGNYLKFFQLCEYDSLNVLKGVVVHQSGLIKVYANGKPLPLTHDLAKFSKTCNTIFDFEKLLDRLSRSEICSGNIERDYIRLVPEGSCISYRYSNNKDAYCERSICTNSLSVSAANCVLLIEPGTRCTPCLRLRNILQNRQKRESDKVGTNNKYKSPFSLLNTPQKIEKLHDLSHQNMILNRKVYELEEKIEMLQRDAKKLLERDSINFSLWENAAISDMVEEMQTEMLSHFEKDSFQDIFFKEQIKFNKLKDKRSMRWHPVVIRWCLFVKNKSASAYEGIRAFLPLPSPRTLYDYTHYTESGLGFREKVLQQLVTLCTQKNLYDQDHTMYVGILQDEVKVKSDLVYDKHSGE